jgi:hypothetical protein
MSDIGKLTTTYWDIQKLRIALSNRLDSTHERDGDILTSMKAIEDGIKKDIKKAVKEIPIWGYWLKDVKGVGETFSAQLVHLIQGQVHTPECKVERDKYFSKKDKGEDKRAQRYECDCPVVGMERFKTISSLWKYAGMDVVNGKAPRRTKGQKITWNPRLRSVCYNIGKSFVMVGKGGYYRGYYDEVKAKEKLKHPELTKGHIDARARRKVVKRFLSHLFVKWYELEGLEAPMPYIHTVGGHTHYVSPP